MNDRQKSSNLLSKPESKEQAVKIINHVGEVLIVLGVITSLGGFLLFTELPFEAKIAMSITGIIYAGLGFLLKKLKKTAIAIILLVLSIADALITSLNFLGLFGQSENTGIPIIGIAVIIASIQAINATRKYNS